MEQIRENPELMLIQTETTRTSTDDNEVTVTVQLKMDKEQAKHMQSHLGNLLNKAVEPLVFLSKSAQVKAVQFSKSAEKITLEVLDEIHEDLHSLKSPYEWPPKMRQKIFHAIVFPVLIATQFTIPNLNNWNPKRWWPLAFFLALLWIVALCFLMVEVANATGCILNISPVVMGLTVLAVGTSFPDFMSSLYSAKAGRGSMCIANCLGSNIFDINVCLGIPWILNILAPPFGVALNMGERGLNGQFIAMFLSYFLTIAACWKLKLAKGPGTFLLCIYVVYIAYVILFAYGVIPDFEV
jgi:Ca2+/Na+ antiporter